MFSTPLYSTACAAQNASIASTFLTFAIIMRAWRDPVVPIDTWSSWFAEDGMESTDAGCANVLFSDTKLAALYCKIIAPDSSPGFALKNAGNPSFNCGFT